MLLDGEGFKLQERIIHGSSWGSRQGWLQSTGAEISLRSEERHIFGQSTDIDCAPLSPSHKASIIRGREEERVGMCQFCIFASRKLRKFSSDDFCFL